MKIAVLAFGSIVNHPYSEYYDKELKVTKPAVALTLPSEYRIQPDSPFALAEGLKLPVRLGRLSRKDSSE